jgi:hypothetical protein
MTVALVVLLLSQWAGAAQDATTQDVITGNESAVVRRNMNMNNTFNGRKDYAQVTARDSVSNVISHPAFEGFGRHIFPGRARSFDGRMLRYDIGTLLPYRGHIDSGTTVRVVNHMISDARKTDYVHSRAELVRYAVRRGLVETE